MNQAAVEQNEAVLGQLLDQGDKKFVGQVGIMALALLSERMPPEGYQGFLAECVHNALAMHSHKMLNSGKGDSNVTT